MPKHGYKRNPIKLTSAIVDEVMFRLAEGESLIKIVSSNTKKFGSYSTLFVWLNKNLELRDRFNHAREIGLQKKADELDEFASKPVKGKTLVELNHRRLVVDTRKWLLSKQLPKKFGDKLDLNHGGQQGNPFIQKIERVIVDVQSNHA